MGDKRRFHEFGEVIEQYIRKDAKIADVAGGKGFLQVNLRERQFHSITTFDKRFDSRRVWGLKYRFAHFNYRNTDKFDAVVAMHPDEGTDHSVLYAVRNLIPFVICPCCVKPSAILFGKNHKFHLWVEHLKNLALPSHKIIEETLPIDGRSLVLIGIPNEQAQSFC